MKNYSGFILLISLILFSVLSLIVISGMHSVLLYLNMNNQLLLKHTEFYALEQALDVIVSRKAFVVNNACENGCKLNLHDKIYHYTISDFGIFPCLQIRLVQNIFSSHHWGIIIFALEFPLEKLSVRIATREPEILCLERTTRFISEGMMSWKYA